MQVARYDLEDLGPAIADGTAEGMLAIHTYHPERANKKNHKPEARRHRGAKL
jgi:hypothetical protein